MLSSLRYLKRDPGGPRNQISALSRFYRFSLPIDSNMGLFIPANKQQLAIKTATPASRSQ
ncbi:hypothetical protein T10_7337 [Trichinella papuae]|uniref:Uncharacterized protein n=1 Tax=Trichinella papuae TaxID=268474 RepID=A0A0V1ML05_9BILA|nr:hypothetical protein T10_7337 [Trichinella papuae]